MYLRTRLLIGIAIVTLFVLAASLLAPLLLVHADVSREIDASMRLARLLLDVQHDVPAEGDGAQELAAVAREVQNARHLRHVNVELLDAAGKRIAASPAEAQRGVWVPRLLLGIGSQTALTYPLRSGGRLLGVLRVSANPMSELAELEHRVAGDLTLLAVAFVAMAGSIYSIVRAGLKPLAQIQAALGELESGVVETRLPPFELKDLDEISQRFNHCAAALQDAAAQRRELTRRLIHVEEEERKRLSRELHDELGQSLTAIKVDAAYIAREAAGRSPKVEACARGVERLTAEVMELIRGMLARLRPHGLETVGLRETLEDLVRGWQVRIADRLDCALTLEGPIDSLPVDLNMTLYRLIQECLTNAVRHSRARSVSIHLVVDADDCAQSSGYVTVTVREQGAECGAAPPWSAGSGLLGMRERVEALSGTLTVRSTESGTISLTARIPIEEPECEVADD